MRRKIDAKQRLRLRLRQLLVVLIVLNGVWAGVWWEFFRWDNYTGGLGAVQTGGPDSFWVGAQFACNPESRLVVEVEGPDVIVVQGQTRGEHLGDCIQGASVALERPAGGRIIVDAGTGVRFAPEPDHCCAYVRIDE